MLNSVPNDHIKSWSIGLSSLKYVAQAYNDMTKRSITNGEYWNKKSSVKISIKG